MGNENLEIKLVLSYICKTHLNSMIWYEELHLDLLLLPNPTGLSVHCTTAGNKLFPTLGQKETSLNECSLSLSEGQLKEWFLNLISELRGVWWARKSLPVALQLAVLPMEPFEYKEKQLYCEGDRGL